MSSREHFVRNLRAALERKGWQNKDLAAAIKMPDSQISRYLADDGSDPSTANLDRLGAPFGLSAADLLRDPNDNPAIQAIPDVRFERLVAALGDVGLITALADVGPSAARAKLGVK